MPIPMSMVYLKIPLLLLWCFTKLPLLFINVKDRIEYRRNNTITIIITTEISNFNFVL
jgi:hypothetical protein